MQEVNCQNIKTQIPYTELTHLTLTTLFFFFNPELYDSSFIFFINPELYDSAMVSYN